MLQIKRSELKQLAKNKLGNDSLESQNKILIKISTAMAARTSYTVVGDEKEFSYEKQIELHDRMANQVPRHSSPFEHCARAMSDEEYGSHVKGWYEQPKYSMGHLVEQGSIETNAEGWCRNYKGFIQYRELLENEKQ